MLQPDEKLEHKQASDRAEEKKMQSSMRFASSGSNNGRHTMASTKGYKIDQCWTIAMLDQDTDRQMTVAGKRKRATRTVIKYVEL